MEPFRNPDDETVRGLLERVRRIAVVGLSPRPHRDSHRVARYLLERGYEIVPVYPREETILGQRVYRRVQDVPARNHDNVHGSGRLVMTKDHADEPLGAIAFHGGAHLLRGRNAQPGRTVGTLMREYGHEPARPRRAVNPQYPFDYRFFDDDYDESYGQYERMGAILRWFAGLAVVVACLGLFGLASYLAEQRRKEIGVRKVLGASSGQVVLLLSTEFARWDLLANLVAWPAAYFAVRSWLQKFPYRTGIAPSLFVLAGAAALIIALITVSGQAWKTARRNPADALRFE